MSVAWVSRAGPVATLAALMVGACADEVRLARPPRSEVVVDDLVLEVDDTERSTQTVVSADRAVLDDLPGVGGGELEGVVVQVRDSGPGSGALTARAERARVAADGAVTLVRASIDSAGDDSLRLTADSARVDPSGVVRGRGVTARMRVR